MPGPIVPELRKAAISLNIVVVGAGIAGIATAYALRRVGHDVTVLEQNDTLIKVRVSPPNMTRILYQWGLEHILSKNAQVSNKIRLFEASTSELLGAIVLHEEFLKQMFLLDMLILEHGDLISLLYDLACNAGVQFQFGSKVTEVIGLDGMDGSHHCIVLTETSHRQCDVVVGADGPTGSVRSVITGLRSEQFSVSDLTLNWVVPVEEILDDDDLKPLAQTTDWNVWLGDGYRLSVTTMNHGRDLDVSMNYRLDSIDAPFSLSELDASKLYPIGHFKLPLGRFHPVLRKLCIHARNVRAMKYLSQPVLDTFICERPRVVLVGEAAHPLMPAGLHNSGLGIEDAQSLATLFSRVQSRDHLAQLITAFDDIRQSRCTFAQEWDLTKYKLFTLAPGPEQEARNYKFKKGFLNKEWENMDEAALQEVWQDEFALFSYDAIEKAEDWWTKWGWLARRASMVPDMEGSDDEGGDFPVMPSFQISVHKG
ncbi:hypothetical protein AMATHDRAFT_149553 [Amanita thiersii Skay4041]|uniref:FAD-binding domain-containing protein n=1 Tax=Amanita thiersii Skay4041 TaxID=703135 RepID=A0A2A9NLK3_9AGAR|nr:hypothetical protein AMATHDRAFT_149553 [Amanita thiersii Skay4041]